MRHRAKGRQLSRTASHKKALLANLATSLFRHDKIVTTEAKAKELRPYAERLITLARRGDLHARRLVERRLKDRDVTHRLFKDLGPHTKDPVVQRQLRDLCAKPHLTLILVDADPLPDQVRRLAVPLKLPLPDEAELEKVVRDTYHQIKSHSLYEITCSLTKRDMEALVQTLRGLTAAEAARVVASAVHDDYALNAAYGNCVDNQDLLTDSIAGCAYTRRLFVPHNQRATTVSGFAFESPPAGGHAAELSKGEQPLDDDDDSGQREQQQRIHDEPAGFDKVNDTGHPLSLL